LWSAVRPTPQNADAPGRQNDFFTRKNMQKIYAATEIKNAVRNGDPGFRMYFIRLAFVDPKIRTELNAFPPETFPEKYSVFLKGNPAGPWTFYDVAHDAFEILARELEHSYLTRLERNGKCF
jgi:hypothetical protein